MFAHHALSSQKVWDDFFVNVVHETPRTLVVIASIDQELLSGVFINEGAHLREEGEK